MASSAPGTGAGGDRGAVGRIFATAARVRPAQQVDDEERRAALERWSELLVDLEPHSDFGRRLRLCDQVADKLARITALRIG